MGEYGENIKQTRARTVAKKKTRTYKYARNDPSSPRYGGNRAQTTMQTPSAAGQIGSLGSSPLSSPYASDWNWQKSVDMSGLQGGQVGSMGGTYIPVSPMTPTPIDPSYAQGVANAQASYGNQMIGSIGQRNPWTMAGTASRSGSSMSPYIMRGSANNSGAYNPGSFTASVPSWTGSPFGGGGNQVYGQTRQNTTKKKNPWGGTSGFGY